MPRPPSGQAHARVAVTSRAELRAWLKAHHAQQESIWLVTYKKADPARHVPYDAIVEEALCFGWVDSLPRKLDDARTMLRLSPRKAGSGWSKANKTRVAKLIAAGLMQAPGLAKITAAKQDGSWTKLDEVETLAVPADLARAFRRYAGAAANFAAFPPSARRGILEWIAQAKTPETRTKRITETAALAAQNKRANQYVRAKPTPTKPVRRRA